jgi:energy-coupling factor transport system permease protein
MIKDITIGQYIPGDSYLHKADPRVKIILTLVFMILVLVVNNYIGFIMLTLFVIIVILVSDIPIMFTLKGLKPVMFIVLFAAIMNVFFYAGSKSTTIYRIAFINITYEGIHASIKMFFVITLIMMGSSLMTLTTTPILLTDGLEKLLGPLKKLKVPVHEIAMMMTIALRFIPTLLEETDKIMKAQASRGADFETGGLIQRAKSFIPILVPLFVSAFRRADELATAMEARCYKGSEGRTRMKQLRLSKVDLLLTLIMLLFSASVIFVQTF